MTGLPLELKHKGVGSAELESALETLPPEDELESAKKQAEKISRRLGGDAGKIMQALVRRGYSWQIAREAVRESAAPTE